MIVQMKIQGQNKQMLAAACQMFMGKSEAEIAQIALETLEGHQRAIIAHLTVEVRVRWFFYHSVSPTIMFSSKVCLWYIAVLHIEAHKGALAMFTTTVIIFLFQEIYKDRKKFSEQVFRVASSDLVNMGISVVSYTLKDVHDDQVNTCPQNYILQAFSTIS